MADQAHAQRPGGALEVGDILGIGRRQLHNLLGEAGGAKRPNRSKAALGSAPRVKLVAARIGSSRWGDRSRAKIRGQVLFCHMRARWCDRCAIYSAEVTGSP